MANRFGSLRTAIDVGTSLLNLEFARRSSRGVSVRYVLLGCWLGFSYRLLEARYVGRARENPFRFIALQTMWMALYVTLVRPSDESAERSIDGGIGLGSAVHRLFERF